MEHLKSISLMESLALLTNIRLELKCQPRTNPVAYYEHLSIKNLKSFIISGTAQADVRKLYTFVFSKFFVLSQSVLPWQAFPVLSNVWGWDLSLLERITFQMLNPRVSTWPWPYTHKLGQKGLPSTSRSSLSGLTFVNYGRKKFCNVSSISNTSYKTFLA